MARSGNARTVLRGVTLVLTTLIMVVALIVLVTAIRSDAARAEARASASARMGTVTRADYAAATPKRHTAMRYAKAQRGDRYCWGGNGPSCYDCSGLIVAAYKRVGITLPRTTYSMQGSGKLRRTSKPRWGDVVFTSSGHVELYVKPGWMFGAHHSGTRIGYKRIYRGAAGYPRYYRVAGAG